MLFLNTCMAVWNILIKINLPRYNLNLVLVDVIQDNRVEISLEFYPDLGVCHQDGVEIHLTVVHNQRAFQPITKINI